MKLEEAIRMCQEGRHEKLWIRTSSGVILDTFAKIDSIMVQETCCLARIHPPHDLASNPFRVDGMFFSKAEALQEELTRLEDECNAVRKAYVKALAEEENEKAKQEGQETNLENQKEP